MSADVARRLGHPVMNHGLSGASSESEQDFSDTMPYLTQQYALPMHHPTLRRYTSDGYESGEQTPRAENSLRRKTPNGTLDEGYDSAFEQPPQKLQLLQLGEAL